MLKNILQKFEKLPEEKKRFLSSPMVLSSLEEIEKKYKVKLALILMEIVVDKSKADNLANFLENRLALKKNIAFQIAQELEGLILREFNLLKDFKSEEERTELDIISEGSIKNEEKPLNFKSKKTIRVDSGEDEIKKIENKIKNLKPIFVKLVDWEKEADRIMSQLNISFKTDLLKNRFKNIIISALKGVRSWIDFKDILERRENEAGMEFSKEIVNKILLLVKKRKQEIENGDGLEKQKQENKEQAKKQIEKEARDLPIIFKSDKIAIDKKNKSVHKNIINKKQGFLSPPPPVIVKEEKNEKKNPLAGEKKIKQGIKQILDKKTGLKKAKSFKDFIFGKKKQEDMKFNSFDQKGIKNFNKIISEESDKKSKLVGPIDELTDLTIKDFRSWSEDPFEAIKKVKEKINILLEESLKKRSLGIKAWKNSEINKAYSEILHNAIIKHKQVEGIIQEMKNERKPTLTLKEFEAIEQLNRELRA
ncbi:MAG: hypothetical protein GWO87_01180 [Xanthomonadaceae bacterium]|nr:hypothetical protein [Rhodospirillaceae bacterium]NIA17788.1 hypothetical protein [Xanthomonadaceae bacterium]